MVLCVQEGGGWISVYSNYREIYQECVFVRWDSIGLGPWDRCVSTPAPSTEWSLGIELVVELVMLVWTWFVFVVKCQLYHKQKNNSKCNYKGKVIGNWLFRTEIFPHTSLAHASQSFPFFPWTNKKPRAVSAVDLWRLVSQSYSVLIWRGVMSVSSVLL